MVSRKPVGLTDFYKICQTFIPASNEPSSHACSGVFDYYYCGNASEGMTAKSLEQELYRTRCALIPEELHCMGGGQATRSTGRDAPCAE